MAGDPGTLSSSSLIEEVAQGWEFTFVRSWEKLSNSLMIKCSYF